MLPHFYSRGGSCRRWSSESLFQVSIIIAEGLIFAVRLYHHHRCHHHYHHTWSRMYEHSSFPVLWKLPSFTAWANADWLNYKEIPVNDEETESSRKSLEKGTFSGLPAIPVWKAEICRSSANSPGSAFQLALTSDSSTGSGLTQSTQCILCRPGRKSTTSLEIRRLWDHLMLSA